MSYSYGLADRYQAKGMRTSDQIDKIYPAFIKAQSEMGGLKKDAANPFYKSQYATLESVLSLIKPIFLKHGIAIIQGSGLVAGYETQKIEGINIVTRLIHESGQWIETDFPVPLARSDAQAAGSSSSYGRRYGLKAIASLAEVDDDGQSASDPDPKADRTDDSLKQITDHQLKEVNNLFGTLGATAEQIQATCRKYSSDRTESTEALMKSEAHRMIGKLRIKLKKQAIDE